MDTIKFPEESKERFKRKAKAVSNLVVDSAMKQMASETTISLALGVGLIQGLKYNGSLKRGIKAGFATLGVVAGANVVKNVARNWDHIKKI